MPATPTPVQCAFILHVNLLFGSLRVFFFRDWTEDDDPRDQAEIELSPMRGRQGRGNAQGAQCSLDCAQTPFEACGSGVGGGGGGVRIGALKL